MNDMEREKQWIEEVKVNPEAFDELFEKYYDPILNYCLKRVGNLQVAQDLTSQVFFIVFKKLWQFKWRNIPFSAWLYRIASNEVAYYFRKNKTKPLSLEVLLETDQWEPVSDCDLEQELRQAEAVIESHQDFLLIQKELQQLPLKYQEVIALKYFEDKKIREISLILGKRDNTVKSLLKRGLHLLEIRAKNQKKLQLISSGLISGDESI